MAENIEIATRSISRALSGRGSHLEPSRVFENLDWKLAAARPDGVSHSIFQVLHHMVFWQDWILKWLDGKRLSTAGSWRSGPLTSRIEWERAIARFKAGLAELSRRAHEESPFDKSGKTSRLEMLHTAASHNSYHCGQIVILRQMLKSWPPSRSRK
jgi:uncharacterized damage-inducible protein DinB